MEFDSKNHDRTHRNNTTRGDRKLDESQMNMKSY